MQSKTSDSTDCVLVEGAIRDGVLENSAVWTPVKCVKVEAAGSENGKVRTLNPFAAPQSECGKSGHRDPGQRAGQDKSAEQRQPGLDGSTGQKNLPSQESKREVVGQDNGAGRPPGRGERNGEEEKPTQRRSLSLRTRKRKRVSVAAVPQAISDSTPAIGWCVRFPLHHHTLIPSPPYHF